jgi:hypothetical protein
VGLDTGREHSQPRYPICRFTGKFLPDWSPPAVSTNGSPWPLQAKIVAELDSPLDDPTGSPEGYWSNGRRKTHMAVTVTSFSSSVTLVLAWMPPR